MMDFASNPERPAKRRWGRRLLPAMATAAMLLAVGIAHAGDHVDGELALEQRLMAPCCWVQTLDIHDSPIAKELREEIHTRLSRGDSASRIEADLVQRYGKRIVAMPASNPLAKVAAVVSGVVLVIGIVLLQLLRRWKARGTAVAPLPEGPQPTQRDEWDDRLDEELESHEE